MPDACLLCDARAGRIPNLCAACAESLVRIPCDSGNRIVAFAYAPPVSTLVHWMKFEANLPATLTLGTLLAEAVESAGARLPNAILPVPLHPGRLRARGFNQALELARLLSRRLARPLLTRTCLRVRATRPQTGLQGSAQRRRNVAGAFRVCRSLDGISRVAIVDDVLTTGATVQELARTLRIAGVDQVLVWACAGRSGGAVRRRDSPPRGRCSR
jgi:ComF family protein